MSNIQAGINQFLSKAAILGRLSPGFDTRQTDYNLMKKENSLKKERSIFDKMVLKGNTLPEIIENAENINQRMVDIRKEQFQNKPSNKNFNKLNNAIRIQKYSKKVYAQEKAAQQLNQKISFDDFKKQLTVRDLPANLQEKAYNEYTTSKK